MAGVLNGWQDFQFKFRQLADEEGQTPQRERLYVNGRLEEHPEISQQEYEEGKPWVRTGC